MSGTSAGARKAAETRREKHKLNNNQKHSGDHCVLNQKRGEQYMETVK